MRVNLQSTTKVVVIEVNGAEVPGRVWEGETEDGIPCAAIITRIAAERTADLSRFERDLQECRDPRPGGAGAEAWPNRLVL